jgi:Iron-containing redox enzyme
VIPAARGALSEAVLRGLRGSARDRCASKTVVEDDHEDAQLSLWLLYELHYRGFDGVDDALEWDPDLLRLRRRLETDLEQRLRARFPGHRYEGAVADALFDYVDAHDGPAIAPYVQGSADADQVRELLRHRSLYHLKEFDPTAWVIPRLPTAPKAALMELAFDEYGVGDPNRLHAHLFARGMAASGLDPRPGAYVDDAPVEILEQNNAMTLLGLHRRLRAAALGHLAAFEATSSSPSRRLAMGLQRLGFDDALVGYYTEHVTADAVHDQLACRSVCGALVEEEPEQAEEVFFGAFTCLDLEARYAARMLEAWQASEQVPA